MILLDIFLVGFTAYATYIQYQRRELFWASFALFMTIYNIGTLFRRL